MVQYKCITCNKKFDKKYNYEVHINRKFKCKQKPREITINDDIELFEEKLEEQKIEIDKINQDNAILKEQNKNLIKLISDMQFEQKNLNNRLNVLETFIIKNININNDFINDELQNGGAIEGLQFENQLFNELKKYRDYLI
jgi:predicted nuclease with TOPRIM domain